MNDFGSAIDRNDLAIPVSKDDALSELIEHGELDFLSIVLQAAESLCLCLEIEQHPAKNKIVKLPVRAKKGRNYRSGPSLRTVRASPIS